jgi:hypothetical protein
LLVSEPDRILVNRQLGKKMSEHRSSPTTQSYRCHALQEAIVRWIKLLADERPQNYESISNNARNAYVRLRLVMRFIKRQLDGANPFLVHKAALDAIDSSLPQLQNQWNQYKSNPDQFFQQLDSCVETIIAQVRLLPETSPRTSEWLEAFDDISMDANEVFESTKLRFEELIASSVATKDELARAKTGVQELTAEIQGQKGRMDTLITQQGESFTKSEQDRAAQSIAAEQARTTAFATSQAERSTQFAAASAGLETSVKKLIEENQEKLDKIETDREKDSSDLVEKLMAQLGRAEVIVGTIVKTTMSGNYQIIANREYKNAWGMRISAVISFLLVGAMIVWAVVISHLGDDGVKLSTVVIRLSFGFLFVLPGIYCARESSRHWAAEKHNRRIALELASLGPFLAELKVEKRDEIIVEKAREYFGNRAQEENDQEGAASASLRGFSIRGDKLFKLLEDIAKIIRGK